MTSYTSLVDASNLTFDDEFNSFVSSPDGSVGWMTTYPSWGESTRTAPLNHEAQYYSDSSVGVDPFSISNGILSITAAPAAAGSNPYDLPYTSGLITTYKSFAQLYGYFEISAELPAGKGLAPAFWLLPANNTGDAELDVFEVLDNAPGTLYVTAHNEVNGVKSAVTDIISVPNTTTGFHTYGVDWEPTTITFYMDGKAIATMATPASMDTPMYMLANLAVGGTGSWEGAPSSSAEFPAAMQINYVRAYATANTIDVSGPDAIETSGITGQVVKAGVGQAGETITLLDASGTVIATTKTNANGTFSFTGLTAGDYQVHYALPPGLDVQNGSPAAQGTGLTSTLALTDGQTLSLATEVLLAPANPATIQSSVLYYGSPMATTGTADAGVTVSLLNAAGTVIATTVSDASGAFSFSNLAAGTYQLEYTPPGGQTLGSAGLTDSLTALVTTGPGRSPWRTGRR